MEEHTMPDFDSQELAVREDTGDPVRSDQLLESFGVDIEQQVMTLKKVAEFAPEIIKYRSIIIKSFTYPSDWVKFGTGDKAKACCSNHAVMRIVDKANFPIKYRDVHSIKEDILDTNGKVHGYRYIFTGYGDMGNRNVYAIGQYSTRDAFLGKAGGNWRDYREINESHIRQAAHSYFKGNVVKDLLGLKAIPWDEFEKLCDFAGQVADKATSVTYHEGGKGGTSDVDRTAQNSLYDELFLLAADNKVVRWREEGGKVVQYIGEPTKEQLDYIINKDNPHQILAQASLKSLRTWFNKEGKLINGSGDFSTVKAGQLKTLTETILPKLIKESEQNG
jgi:hypothetical protein